MFYLSLYLISQHIVSPRNLLRWEREKPMLCQGFPTRPVPSPPFPHILKFGDCCYGLLGYHVCPALCNEGNRPHSRPREMEELVQG